MGSGFLIDMDGVVYRGDAMIAGADEFVARLRRLGLPFRFLTNNSQRTRRDMAAKVARLGIEVEEEHIFTSAMATARYLARQKPGTTYCRSADPSGRPFSFPGPAEAGHYFTFRNCSGVSARGVNRAWRIAPLK